MTTIAHCTNEAEAMLLKSLLESNGVKVFEPEELTPQAGFHFAGSGLRLQVEDEDAITARKILAAAEHPVARDREPPPGEEGAS